MGRHLTIWRAVPLPHSHEGRIALLLVLLAGSVALAALALRSRPAALVLNVEGGSLRLPPDTLERYLAAELARDPDVVVVAGPPLRCATSAHRPGPGWPLRPLAPPAVLRERLAGAAQAALRDKLELAVEVREPVVKVLRVHDLPRYLR